MKIFKDIFGRIWAVWGILSFAATMLLVIIPLCITYLIPEPNGMRVYAFISRWWMRAFLFLIACPFKVYGKQNFKKGQTYVVIGNHNSLMDVPLLTPFLPGGNKTIAKKSIAKTPLFGWIYARGAVLVDRNSDASRRKSFDDMKRVLNSGLHMLLYPEGTRNRTGQPLKSFYDGAFRLAVNTQKDIVPVCVFGTGKALPANKPFYLMPTVLRVYILPPIPVNGQTADSLKKISFDTMWAFIEQQGFNG
ncbi:MAG: lysophospholipid acyltransferase family protein [Chitinophagaceae bacterium]